MNENSLILMILIIAILALSAFVMKILIEKRRTLAEYDSYIFYNRTREWKINNILTKSAIICGRLRACTKNPAEDVPLLDKLTNLVKEFEEFDKNNNPLK